MNIPQGRGSFAGWQLILVGWVLLGMPFGVAAQAVRKTVEPIPIRIGIVVYQDLRDYDLYKNQVFAALQKASQSDGGPPVRFELARGRYDEILDWFKRGHIDAAIAPAGVFDALRAIPGVSDADQPKGKDGLQAGGLRYRYLGTKFIVQGGSPATSEAHDSGSAAATASAPTEPLKKSYTYRSTCYVNSQSSIRTYRDLKALASQGGVEFLLVEPLSLSGDLMFRLLSQDMGRDYAPGNEFTYTYSHTNSLRLLMERDNAGQAKTRVAIVYESSQAGLGSEEQSSAPESLHRVSGTPLDHEELPATAFFVRAGDANQTNLKLADRLRDLLYTPEGNARIEHGFELLPRNQWIPLYDKVRDLKKRLGLGGDDTKENRLRLLDIQGLLRRFEETHGGRSPRLALVLSGGGAKCAYQVGAVRAIEEMLAELNADAKRHPIDLSPIVGTSGGAINALPVAMGATKVEPAIPGAESSYDRFRSLWTDLDQRNILRPSPMVEMLNGLLVAAITCLFLAILGYLMERWLRITKGTRVIGGLVILLALGLLALLSTRYGALVRLEWFSDHRLQHAWTLLTIGGDWVGIGLLLAGGVFATVELTLKSTRRFPWTRLVSGVILVVTAIYIGDLTLWEKSVFGHAQIEKQLTDKYRRLVWPETETLSTARRRRTGETRSEIVSRDLFEQGKIVRDLVITGSHLTAGRTAGIDAPPDDFYFYYRASSVPPPTYGSKGVSLSSPDPARPTDPFHLRRNLFKIVAGSGAIYPLFPPSRIVNAIKGPDGQYLPVVNLIDGSFAHNSPIEAAVDWGATHVFLIEASPAVKPSEENYLLQNFVAAFNHLYQQAQRIDDRSRERVVVFTLTPGNAGFNSDLLDFTSAIIGRTIQRGYNEATQGVEMVDPQGNGSKRYAPFQVSAGIPIYEEIP